MKEKTLPLLCLLALCASPAQAIILFGVGNAGNTTDPNTGAPFASVARLSNGSTIGGSGIYLGNGYVLTADHVTPFSSVTFDGTTSFSHDGLAPQQVGSTDMKIFRLTTTPTVAAVPVYTGTSELGNSGTLVGWGVGRDPLVPVNSADVAWGANSTSDRRWGLNVPRATTNISYGAGSYEALVTVLGGNTNPNQGLGADEAALTLFDSGSGMFQQFGGVWYLTGLATAVEFANESSFGQDATTGINRGDFNYFVRVGSYSSDINAIIPEPSSLLLTAPALLLLLRRRR